MDCLTLFKNACLSVGGAIIIAAGSAVPAAAQLDAPAGLTVSVGQKTVFTEFDYYEAWVQEGVAGLAMPEEVFSQAEENHATAYVRAGAGQAARAFAQIGIWLRMDPGNTASDEVMNKPVSITFDVVYDLSGYSAQGTAYAGMAFPDLKQDSIIISVGDLHEEQIFSFQTWEDGTPLTVADFLAEPVAMFAAVHAQAYTAAGSDLSSAEASLMLNRITVEFPDADTPATTTAVNTVTTTLPRSTTTTAPKSTSTTTTSTPLQVLTADFVGRPRSGPAPLAVGFFTSGTGKFVEALWNFGDGHSGSGQSLQHVYEKPGSYTVMLTVVGADGTVAEKQKNDYIVVEEGSLAAKFAADRRTGTPPLEVQFMDNSTGDVAEWEWDFGDGEASPEQNPRHTFGDPGRYSVRLSVFSPDGRTNTLERADYIHVLEGAPEADFSVEPDSGTAPLTVRFTDTSTGDIAKRLWNFGDGEYTDEAGPEHTYRAPGTYSVGLKVQNSQGVIDVELKEGAVSVLPGSDGLSVTGTVSGAGPEEVIVFLNGKEARDTLVSENGTYAFQGLQSGSYRVTPHAARLAFDPPSRQVELFEQSAEAVDFAASLSGPSIVSASADPEKISNDGETPLLFLVQVEHPQGAGALESVSIDLTPVGGEANQPVYDDGTSGDETPGDGVYSFQTTLGPEVKPGPKAVRVTAEDATGAERFAVIELAVVREVTRTVEKNSAQKENIDNDIDGQTLVISYELTGGGAGAGMTAASESSVVLQLYDPDGEPYFDEALTVSTQSSELEVDNAAPGIWNVEVENQGAQSTQYRVSVSTSGTGVILGMVVDSVTGLGLNGATVTTNAGGASNTADGYYVILHAAGVYSVQARAMQANYSTATESVNLLSGMSAEVNLSLSETAADNGSSTCFLSDLLAGADARGQLGLLRAFRDDVLRKTAAGRRLIDRYYRFSPEMTSLVKAHPGLKAALRACVLDYLPSVRRSTARGRLELNAGQKQHLRALLKQVADRAGAGLQNELGRFLSGFKDNPVLKESSR